MSEKLITIILIIIIIGVVYAFYDYLHPVSKENNQTQMPNPAAVCCEKNNAEYLIRTDEKGEEIQSLCVFPDGKKLDAWEYFREKCK